MYLIFVFAFCLIFSCGCGRNAKVTEPNLESFELYRAQLTELREEFREYDLPEAVFFLFGMGNRDKFIYRQGKLIAARTGEILHEWEIESEIIIPNNYSVFITTLGSEKIVIYEDELGVHLETDRRIETLTGGSKLSLPGFEGYRFPEVMKVLNHEILINRDEGLPLPNFLTYRKPWRRDAAMMAMCLEVTGNLDLIKEWVLGLDEAYDFNNRTADAPEHEVDNLGQTLYLISLFSDGEHALVPEILEEAKRWERIHEGKLYLHGRTDFAEKPAFQTKRMKYGLRALGLPDPMKSLIFNVPIHPFSGWITKNIN